MHFRDISLKVLLCRPDLDILLKWVGITEN